MLLSVEGFSQQITKVKKSEIVKNLNSPTKIWVDGFWEVEKNGSKVWKKGHWIFKERSFQKSSELLKKKTTIKPLA
jgi:uncharacterized protein with PIN domain